jgi:outer membrane biosynthesis protein TonB
MTAITAPAPANWAGYRPPSKPTRRETPKSASPARKMKDRNPPASVQPGKTNAWIRAGGMPPYPDGLPEGTISVTVHVDCLIGTDGAPSDCRVSGDAPFRRAVQRWLGSGKVRFAPVLRKGVPVEIRQAWDVQFEGDD